jgi:hypothetical protein
MTGVYRTRRSRRGIHSARHGCQHLETAHRLTGYALSATGPSDLPRVTYAQKTALY